MPTRSAIQTGARFGRLTILGRVQRHGQGGYFDCACDCGGKTITSTSKLRSGHTSSCGCLRYERLKASRKNEKHGCSRNKNRRGSDEYVVWQGMKRRCTDPNNKRYKDYGGRGIRVCAEWLHSFEAFLAHAGKRPSMEHTIDRINNDGHYEPGNVRWVTRAEQNRNKRRSKQPPRVTIERPDGERVGLAEIARTRRLKYATVHAAWRRGADPFTFTPRHPGACVARSSQRDRSQDRA